MRLALEQADVAEKSGEVPVGAVLVADGKLIAAAGNTNIGENDCSAHAEINALRMAGRAMNNYRLEPATLYVTLEPCVMCAGAMVHARLERVVFGCYDNVAGAAGSIANILQTPFLNHRCDIVAGILEQECATKLRGFFASRR